MSGYKALAALALVATHLASPAQANTLAPETQCTFLTDRAEVESRYPDYSHITLYDDGRVQYRDSFKTILLESRAQSRIRYAKAPGRNQDLYSLSILYRHENAYLTLSAGSVWKSCLDQLQARFSEILIRDDL